MGCLTHRGIRVRFWNYCGAFRFSLLRETTSGALSFKKNRKKSVKNTGLFQRVVCTVLGDSAQSLAGKLHTDETTLAPIELRHPDALLLKVRIHGAVHHLRDVTTDTALLLGKTGAMNAAAFVRHGKRDIADSGHKILR